MQDCPFCGSAEVTALQSLEVPRVYCRDCGAMGPVSCSSGDAITKWNERSFCEHHTEYERYE